MSNSNTSSFFSSAAWSWQWWPDFNLSYLTSNFQFWSNDLAFSSFSTAGQMINSAFRWPQLSFSVIDSMLWTLVMAFESVVLATILCLFFILCGCTF